MLAHLWNVLLRCKISLQLRQKAISILRSTLSKTLVFKPFSPIENLVTFVINCGMPPLYPVHSQRRDLSARVYLVFPSPFSSYPTKYATSIMSSPPYSSYADEKRLTRYEEQNASLNPRSRVSFRGRLFGHFLPAFLLMSAALLLFRSIFVTDGHYDASKDLSHLAEMSGTHQGILEGRRVDLEAHIMSKCPDARDCLQQLVVPAMAQVSDKVNFKLSYIGK